MGLCRQAAPQQFDVNKSAGSVWDADQGRRPVGGNHFPGRILMRFWNTLLSGRVRLSNRRTTGHLALMPRDGVSERIADNPGVAGSGCDVPAVTEFGRHWAWPQATNLRLTQVASTYQRAWFSAATLRLATLSSLLITCRISPVNLIVRKARTEEKSCLKGLRQQAEKS
jgi:hypothetical protein